MEIWIILLTIVIGLVIYLYCRFTKKVNYFEKYGIPHIKPLPFLGNMGPTMFRRVSLMENIENAYNLNRDAKYVGFFEFGTPVVLIRDMALAKNITVKYFDNFMNHRGFGGPKNEPIFGNSLFELRDDKWREVRNLLSPAFTSSKMKSMFKLMSECATSFTDYLVEQSEKKPYEVNSKDAFTRYASDVIATCAFGITVDSMRNPKNEFFLVGRESTDVEGALSLKFFLVPNFPKLAKFFGIKLLNDRISNFFIQLVKNAMAVRDEKGITRSDLIQLLMETRNNDGHGPKLTIEEMTAQAYVFLLGGLDTSASLMCFAAHEIATHPDIQAKLQSEVDEVFRMHNEDPPYDAINGMAYLDAVISEALRMYPVATVLDRVCNKEFKLPPTLPGEKPLTLKPGSQVWVSVYPFHRDPKYFPNPNVFLPERFISSGKSSGNLTFPLLSFGVGPRMCIGNRFALLETKVLLAQMMRKCSIKPAKRMITPLKLSTSSFAVTAEGGFWLKFQPRQVL